MLTRAIFIIQEIVHINWKRYQNAWENWVLSCKEKERVKTRKIQRAKRSSGKLRFLKIREK